MRKRIGGWLRDLADHIDREHAFECMTEFRLHYGPDASPVFTVDNTSVGLQLWFKADEYDEAWRNRDPER